MDLEEAVLILEDLIARDRYYRGFGQSDFDKFCEEKNKAIETLIDYIKNNISKETVDNKIKNIPQYYIRKLEEEMEENNEN
jgi:hypothetical protein